jgi:hypothetical protein
MRSSAFGPNPKRVAAPASDRALGEAEVLREVAHHRQCSVSSADHMSKNGNRHLVRGLDVDEALYQSRL